MKLQTLADGRLYFDCPGCGMMHAVAVDAAAPGPRWQWNGSMEAPTFEPSILVTWEWGEDRQKRVCHSYVTDGRIRFLEDCTHSLVNQTADIPEAEA